MNIETAKELKALEVGYPDWNALVEVYSRYDRVDMIYEYLSSANSFVEKGIPIHSKTKIITNIQIFGSRYADKIRENIEQKSKMPVTNESVRLLMDLISSL